ncbi:HNH endonuclease [Diaphorobacter sp. HDW4A]|uniref:HNH endonuclease n=1 Tax=Diaphorobacter sp. HDW4A TaxID=2714924 RepID=UPI00140B8922|nr:HNH endonuclease [Diaphorobacter sp. HDW4A]QIL79338.1 HNH endonuclease [Diaphorobacter sp. HDW4A]
MNQYITELTDPNAVRQAIAECDQLGRDGFLKKHNCKRSWKHRLEYNGNLYDSDAIATAAFSIQHQRKPRRPRELPGSHPDIKSLLAHLGFLIVTTPNPSTELVIGDVYKRVQLAARYGGSLQPGIWTLSQFPSIFLFTGASGEAYGYSDGWLEKDVFRYTGEGQEGDMKFTKGNLAIRDHYKNQKDLLLFKDLGKGNGVSFEGCFQCASWEEVRGKDKNKVERKVIVFQLIATTDTPSFSYATTPRSAGSPDSYKTHAELRDAALIAAETPSQQKQGNTKRTWYERSQHVKTYVLARANGICEACKSDAPFMRLDGTPYLEPHHTQRMADDGPDHPQWVGAICPNCHRRIHSGVDGKQWNEQLQLHIKALEDRFTNEATQQSQRLKS